MASAVVDLIGSATARIRNSSGGLRLAGQQRRSRMAQAVAGDCLGQIRQGTTLLKATGLGNGEQSGGNQFPCGGAIAEGRFAPLDAGAERAFSAVIGRLDASVFEEGKEPFGMFKQCPRQVLHLPVRTIEMSFRQRKQTPLEPNRPL